MIYMTMDDTLDGACSLTDTGTDADTDTDTHTDTCYGVMQYVAVCSCADVQGSLTPHVLQCVAVYCSVLQCIAVYY